jgi:hypothetical protein
VGNEDERARLQQIAFGNEATPAERTAALRRLAPSFGPPASPADRDREAGARSEPTKPAVDSDVVPPLLPTRARNPWVVRTVIALGALALGLIAGPVLGLGGNTDEDGLPSSPSAPSSAEPASSPAAVAALEKILSRSPQPTDRYPYALGKDDPYVDSSSRRLLTGRGSSALWVARRTGAGGGFCFLTTNADPEHDSESSGETTCLARTALVHQGVTIFSDAFLIGWRGDTLTVSLGN